MKKSLLAAITAALATVSCEKNYTCQCKIIDKGILVKTVSYTETLSKSKAKKWCSGQASITVGTPTSETVCNLN